MDRRMFFQQVAILGFGESLLAPPWIGARYGWFRGFADREWDRWRLEFDIRVRRADTGDGFRERLMVPTETFREALVQVGLEMKIEGPPPYFSLVGSVKQLDGPKDLLARIRNAVEGRNWESLWVDPCPSEWDQYIFPMRPEPPQIWVG